MILPHLNKAIVLSVLCVLCVRFQGFAFEKSMNIEVLNNEIEVLSDSLSNPKIKKFDLKYKSLISRAYFRIIVEAEKADIKLGKKYAELYTAFEKSMANVDSEEELFEFYEKFMAHRRMLSGLKSWRIFCDQPTGDLKYFKAENYEEIFNMYQRGSNDFTMIKVLMYKLADLYHFGE